jgi:signal transduction histidine kinase
MCFTANADGGLIEVNQAGARLFRYADSNEMCRIESIASLFRDAEAWRLLWERIEVEGSVKDVRVEMRRIDGSFFPACISASLCASADKTVACEGILRDTTELEELQTTLEESERRIKEIGHSQMILSHDLRGLLTSLGAGLELLVRGWFGAVDEKVAKALQRLLSETVRLKGIVEDHLARAAAIDGFGEIRKEALDLAKDVINPVLEEFVDLILTGRIRIERSAGAVSEGAVTVHGAAIWLKSVYRNLLKNAAQYGGKRCVVAFGYEDHGHFYRLNVHNSGEPVPEDFRGNLFTKFSRVGRLAGRAVEGTGLGLYLAREIIRKHGGDVWYEATQSGSNFVFTIPKEMGK